MFQIIWISCNALVVCSTVTTSWTLQCKHPYWLPIHTVAHICQQFSSLSPPLGSTVCLLMAFSTRFPPWNLSDGDGTEGSTRCDPNWTYTRLVGVREISGWRGNVWPMPRAPAFLIRSVILCPRLLICCNKNNNNKYCLPWCVVGDTGTGRSVGRSVGEQQQAYACVRHVLFARRVAPEGLWLRVRGAMGRRCSKICFGGCIFFPNHFSPPPFSPCPLKPRWGWGELKFSESIMRCAKVHVAAASKRH